MPPLQQVLDLPRQLATNPPHYGPFVPHEEIIHEVQNPHLYGPEGRLDAAPAVQNPLLQEQAQQQPAHQPLPRPNFLPPYLTQQQEQAAVQELETKPIDRFQAGLNAAEVYEAQLNAIAASRGFVDQQGRYRSFSSERRNQAYPSASQNNGNSRFPSGNGLRKMSQNRDSSRNRPDSRDAKTRTPSNGYRNSSRGNQNNFQRSQSKSPSRNGAPLMNSANRQSRADSRADFRSANRSTSARRNYPQMRKGINCSPDYDPYTMKKCTKCLKPGHHEFECARYYSYSARLCHHCGKMNHADNDCQEAKAFPPNTNQKN